MKMPIDQPWLLLLVGVALGCGSDPGPNTAGNAEAEGPHEAAAAAGTMNTAGASGDGATADAANDATSKANDTSDAAGTSSSDGEAEMLRDAGSAGCAGLFCEDFEQGELDQGKWEVMAGVNHVASTMSTTVVQQETVAHGKYAAHFHGQGGVPSDYAFIIAKNLPAALRVHHFGRAYFFITPKPQSGHTQMVFAGTTGFAASPKLKYLEVANINGGWQLAFAQLDVPPIGEECAYPPGQVPVMAWTCMEWEFSDQPDRITFWVDGKEVGGFDDQDIAYPPGHVPGAPIFNNESSGLVGGFTDFGVGFFDWHPVNAFDLYYDDIVLDVKRVTCL